ncbi:unnamed protein product [Rangifer tarandus platyrhynchus]|uniref:Uncharacterized protein n=1 Tax=Rangifer tarandus platyrhynchus TaxID=3082113 RepID=A0AC59YLG2_RANTA
MLIAIYLLLKRGIQSISASPSAPQVRRNTNQSLVQPFRKLGHQTPTLLLPPNMRPPGAPGPDCRATAVLAGSLVPSHASSTNAPSQGRVTSHSDSPQKAGTSDAMSWENAAILCLVVQSEAHTKNCRVREKTWFLADSLV